MALDTVLVEKQQKRLAEYRELSRQIGASLKVYRSQLNAAWSAAEITYFNRVIEDLGKKSRQLDREMELLQEKIAQAASEIAKEEAAEEAAFAGGAV